MNTARKILKYISIFLVSLYILMELSGNLLCSVNDGRSYLNAYRLINSCNRFALLFYLEGDIKSYNNCPKQELSKFYDLPNYKYSTEVTEKVIFHKAYEVVSTRDLCVKDAAPLLTLFLQNKATPKYTSIGAVFLLPQGESKNIICESQTPGWQKLNKPYLRDGKPVCGEGTSKFTVN